ncbi:PREDICTED: membrane-spanning 4-domains subfamily A member 15 isoform X2 [Capra hircus]|uniref:membrane-spanning 4-domains subfamily A member 15 isoform X2 n=1 Tax=Capra hircus TaxID=9925 RepID=UPI000846956A|nr:PREDICTED: membrane-spanning 4-domains subfamily A member 15 isoform X2 [Capra hircus]
MSTAPSSNGVFVVIPPSNTSGLRSPQAILPTSLCQPPGIMQYEEQPLGAQTPRVTQPQDLRPGETFLTGEPKALGFIISGSLSVAAEKNHTSCLVRISLGTNILSAMAAFAGTAILLMDFGVTNWDVGRGYLAVLTIFTILEFFIAVIATHFGCQATRAQAHPPVIFLPNAFSTDFNISSPAASPPPAYDNVAYIPKESSE